MTPPNVPCQGVDAALGEQGKGWGDDEVYSPVLALTCSPSLSTPCALEACCHRSKIEVTGPCGFAFHLWMAVLGWA